MASYKGFTYNGPGEPPPWGAIENQLDFDLIDTIVGDACVNTKDAAGHKHSKLYDSSGATAFIDNDLTRLVLKANLRKDGGALNITPVLADNEDLCEVSVECARDDGSGGDAIRIKSYADVAGTYGLYGLSSQALLAITKDGSVGTRTLLDLANIVIGMETSGVKTTWLGGIDGDPIAEIKYGYPRMTLTGSGGAQLRLQEGEPTDIEYCDFTVDSEGDLTIAAYIGGIILDAGSGGTLSLKDDLLDLSDGLNIGTGPVNGTIIGRAGGIDKLAFFGATPVVQQAHISDPAGGGTVDSEARTAINSILALVETLGFTATS